MRNITEETAQIPEMYVLRHKHDTALPEMGFNYSENLLNKTLSPVLYNNTNNIEFLDKLSEMMVAMIDSVLPTRNIFFYSHNKYFNKHGK
jgi:hypothetical protein